MGCRLGLEAEVAGLACRLALLDEGWFCFLCSRSFTEVAGYTEPPALAFPRIQIPTRTCMLAHAACVQLEGLASVNSGSKSNHLLIAAGCSVTIVKWLVIVTCKCYPAHS
eukprot:1154663-Pelagomonas_calceolata.AAC.3